MQQLFVSCGAATRVDPENESNHTREITPARQSGNAMAACSIATLWAGSPARLRHLDGRHAKDGVVSSIVYVKPIGSGHISDFLEGPNRESKNRKGGVPPSLRFWPMRFTQFCLMPACWQCLPSTKLVGDALHRASPEPEGLG